MANSNIERCQRCPLPVTGPCKVLEKLIGAGVQDKDRVDCRDARGTVMFGGGKKRGIPTFQDYKARW